MSGQPSSKTRRGVKACFGSFLGNLSGAGHRVDPVDVEQEVDVGKVLIAWDDRYIERALIY